MNRKNIAEIIGWCGAVAILLAYILVSAKIISASGYLYQLLNLGGAIGMLVIAFVKKVEQSVVINIIWAIIAIIAIIGLVVHG
ncbi:MAG: hypothetical protein WCJ36_03635 [Candidatus Saccharibacteria bacterium]